MSLLSGTHYCTNCGKDLYWEYSISERWDNARAFQYTKGSLRPILLNNKQSEFLKFSLECTKCKHINDFTYDNHTYCNVLKLHQRHF